jgi:hypothetical protein
MNTPWIRIRYWCNLHITIHTQLSRTRASMYRLAHMNTSQEIEQCHDLVNAIMKIRFCKGEYTSALNEDHDS